MHHITICLLGAPGIGKSSIALTVLHDDRIKRRFGDNRVFIRCDEIPASRARFLHHLSAMTGAGIENPEDLSTLRPFLSSEEMLIVLDNAESILDPRGPNTQEIYAAVEELARFNNICLCVTSRISTLLLDCEIFDIPTLTTEAANDAFHQIYKHGERSDAINNILDQLDFHPLSTVLLATVAQQNKWDTRRLTIEWEKQHTGLLHAQHFGSLAATIESSLASSTFRELGLDARSVLEVIAFFPQGVNEENNFFYDTQNMLDKFCMLSLTDQSDRFVTMLAPIRDYLRPKDPASSSLLAETKDRYFARLSGSVIPGRPGFEEARWITTEDANVEHLLDVFTTIDENSDNVWAACSGFMNRLYWHKPRLVTLRPKIEALRDSHPAKAQCLWELSRLFGSVGNYVERKRLLVHTLKLWREQGDSGGVAQTLSDLSDTSRRMGFYQEGIEQAKEAFEICERLGDALMQAECLGKLALLLREDKQLEAAEEAASRAINLIPREGQELLLCESHRVLGDIYQSKGEREEAICHFEMALKIATPFTRYSGLFWTLHSIAELFRNEDRFQDAAYCIECAEWRSVGNAYLSAHVLQQRARLLDQQARIRSLNNLFQDAKSEALRALAAFEKLGAANDAEATRQLLHQIEANVLGISNDDGEPPRDNPPCCALC